MSTLDKQEQHNDLPIILLVEDEPAIRNIIKRVITREINKILKNPDGRPIVEYLEADKGEDAINAMQKDTQGRIVAVITDNTLTDGFKGLTITGKAVEARIPYVTTLSSYSSNGLIFGNEGQQTPDHKEIASRAFEIGDPESGRSSVCIEFGEHLREVICILKPADISTITKIAQEIAPHIEEYDRTHSKDSVNAK